MPKVGATPPERTQLLDAFDDDLPQELNYVRERALAAGAVAAAVSTHWAEGEGGLKNSGVPWWRRANAVRPTGHSILTRLPSRRRLKPLPAASTGRPV